MNNLNFNVISPSNTSFNCGHSLSNGLIFFAPCNEGFGGNNFRDVTKRYLNRGNIDNPTFMSVKPVFINGRHAYGINSTSTANSSRMNFQVGGDSNRLKITSTKYSASVWFRAGDITGNSYWFFNYGTAGGVQSTMFRFSKSGSIFSFFVRDNNVAGASVSFTIAANTWYHAVGIRNDNNVYLYINGAYIGTSSAAFSTMGTLYLTLGGSPNNSGNNYIGDTANPMVWDRLLSPTEIYTLYQNPYCVLMGHSTNKGMYNLNTGAFFPFYI